MICAFAAALGKQEGRSKRSFCPSFSDVFPFSEIGFFQNWFRKPTEPPAGRGGIVDSDARFVMSRTIVVYLVLAMLFALLLLWLLLRFLSCCCSPIDAAFCQLASLGTTEHKMLFCCTV